VGLISGSDIDERNLLGYLQTVMQMTSISLHEQEGVMNTFRGMEPEYACLRSMMLEPQNPTMWNALALVYIMTNRYDDARDAIERSLDLDTSVAWTWSIWGNYLSLLGDELESIRAYRMAVELGSDEPHVLQQLVLYNTQRGYHLETLSLLVRLIPQFPDNQSLWDIYTECFQHTCKQIRE
jgi:tetratricopeptide (TPR) repeat protein